MRNAVCTPNRSANRYHLDNLFDNFFNFPVAETGRSTEFSPRVDILENDEAYSLVFELPGLEKSDIRIMVKDNLLTVSGERKFEKDEKKDGYVRSEIRTGSFSRSFTLPEDLIDDSISADYKNGLLHITLPKAEKAKPKEINVQVS